LYRIYRKKGAALINLVERLPGPLTKMVSIALTFHFVCIGWVFFATDLDKSFQFLGALF
jgi:D-alanyl-lipoteichoic acid acyltransferase DltB (MBOAT superfamily)